MASNRSKLYNFWIHHDFFPPIARQLEHAFKYYDVQELIQLPDENILFILNNQPDIKRHHKKLAIRVLEEEYLRLLHNGNTRNNSPIYFFFIDGLFTPVTASMLEDVFVVSDVKGLLAMSDYDILRRLDTNPAITSHTKKLAFQYVEKVRNKEEEYLRLLHNGNTRINSPIYFFWIDGLFTPVTASMLEDVFMVSDVKELLAMSHYEILRRLDTNPAITSHTKKLVFQYVEKVRNKS